MAETRREGVQLDAEVAEKVMGWARWDHAGDWNGADDVTFFTVWDEATPGVDVYHPDDDGDVSFIFAPSSLWRDAGLVVGEMGRRGFHARIQSPFIPGDDYHAGFTPHGASGWNGRPDFAADAPTAPLAICRAALAALSALEPARP